MRLLDATWFGGIGLVLSCQSALGFDDFTPGAPAPESGGASGVGRDDSGSSGSSNTGGTLGRTGGSSGSGGASGSSADGAPPDVAAGSGGSAAAGGSAGSSGNECIVYVDDDTGNDGNDGTSWARAVATVTRGLAVAAERVGDSGTATCELWVTAGTYKPVGTDRAATFQLRSQVALYGGFQGTETLRKDRNWRTRVTTLSGDLDGDDVPGTLPTGNNAYHVVTSAEGAILDGFTIVGGRADVSTGPLGPKGRGGGMLASQGVPVIKNCTFSDNYAVEGGAIDLSASDVTVANTRFLRNKALYDGGAAQVRGSATFVNCLFSSNRAEGIAGAVYGHNGRVTFHSSTIIGNESNIADNPLRGVDVFVINSIVWENGVTRVSSGYGITYSAIDFSYPGVGNLSKADGGILDPQFLGSFRLSDASVCVEAGDKGRLPTDKLDLDEDGVTDEVLPVDLDGLPRIHLDRLDMGAFENHR
jgi:hypothetical protein